MNKEGNMIHRKIIPFSKAFQYYYAGKLYAEGNSIEEIIESSKIDLSNNEELINSFFHLGSIKEYIASEGVTKDMSQREVVKEFLKIIESGDTTHLWFVQFERTGFGPYCLINHLFYTNHLYNPGTEKIDSDIHPIVDKITTIIITPENVEELVNKVFNPNK